MCSSGGGAFAHCCRPRGAGECAARSSSGVASGGHRQTPGTCDQAGDRRTSNRCDAVGEPGEQVGEPPLCRAVADDPGELGGPRQRRSLEVVVGDRGEPVVGQRGEQIRCTIDSTGGERHAAQHQHERRRWCSSEPFRAGGQVALFAFEQGPLHRIGHARRGTDRAANGVVGELDVGRCRSRRPRRAAARRGRSGRTSPSAAERQRRSDRHRGVVRVGWPAPDTGEVST